MLNRDEKNLMRVFFKNRIYYSDGQSFEDLFIAIMRNHNPNFNPVKPQGNIGDRKNDGFDQENGIYYQVFAPEDIRKSQSDAIKKLNEDFRGLYEFWDEKWKVREYYFVLNDKYNGAYPGTYELLSSLKKEFHLHKAGVILAQHLEKWFFELPEEVQIELIQYVPNPEKINRNLINFSSLKMVIDHLLREKTNIYLPPDLTAPDFDEKIKFNDLHNYCSSLLINASYQYGQLEKYFLNEDPEIRTEIRDLLNSKYNELKISEITTSDFSKSTHIFFNILEFIANGSKELEIRNAAAVVMAYYFESCDIFDDPNKV